MPHSNRHRWHYWVNARRGFHDEHHMAGGGARWWPPPPSNRSDVMRLDPIQFSSIRSTNGVSCAGLGTSDSRHDDESVACGCVRPSHGTSIGSMVGPICYLNLLTWTRHSQRYTVEQRVLEYTYQRSPQKILVAVSPGNNVGPAVVWAGWLGTQENKEPWLTLIWILMKSFVINLLNLYRIMLISFH